MIYNNQEIFGIKIVHHYVIMGDFYKVILENIIRSKYSELIINCALKGA